MTTACHAVLMATLAALEAESHVQPEEMVEEKPMSQAPSATAAWEEGRREERLAGGA
jgi:hypothetical protein